MTLAFCYSFGNYQFLASSLADESYFPFLFLLDLLSLDAQSLFLCKAEVYPTAVRYFWLFSLEGAYENLMSILCTFSFCNPSGIQVNKRKWIKKKKKV